MKLLSVVSLLCGLLTAYQPGGLFPVPRSLVNFGTNPFVQNNLDPHAYYLVPGFTGGSVVGNQLLSSSQAPQLFVSVAEYATPGLGSEIEVRGSMAFQAVLNTDVPVGYKQAAGQKASGPILSPKGIDGDPLYGSSQFGVFDHNQGWLFSLLETNTRIYALYGRLPSGHTPLNDYYSFAFLVPVATRTSVASNNLAIVMNKAHSSLSYRIEGVERLYIERVGRPLDTRFLLSDYGGSVFCKGFPETFHVIIGTGMLPVTGEPYTACQTTQVFDQCIDTIYDAGHVCCSHVPKQNSTTYLLDYTLTVRDFGVTEWGPQFDCLNVVTLDVANPDPEPFCFGGCPVFPVPIPPVDPCLCRLNECSCDSVTAACCDRPVCRVECACAPVEEAALPVPCPVVRCPPTCNEPIVEAVPIPGCHRRAHRRRREERRCKSSSDCYNNSPVKPVVWGPRTVPSENIPAYLRFGPNCGNRNSPYFKAKLESWAAVRD